MFTNLLSASVCSAKVYLQKHIPGEYIIHTGLTGLFTCGHWLNQPLGSHLIIHQLVYSHSPDHSPVINQADGLLFIATAWLPILTSHHGNQPHGALVSSCRARKSEPWRCHRGRQAPETKGHSESLGYSTSHWGFISSNTWDGCMADVD